MLVALLVGAVLGLAYSVATNVILGKPKLSLSDLTIVVVFAVLSVLGLALTAVLVLVGFNVPAHATTALINKYLGGNDTTLIS